ncbi:hypothetical protein [Mesonia phycicola]|nr:hypothetical protein [Mesonia phycicola]
MNILRELTQKYQGKYAEENLKSINSPLGKLNFQPQNSVLFIDDTKITISINVTTGAHLVGEPYRITLHLKSSVKPRLEIYPASFWNRFLYKNNKYITKKLAINYCFKTDEKLFLKFIKHKNFCKILEQDEVYIRLYPEKNQLVLTPKKGIENVNQFEHFLQLLKIIEKELVAF